jgi:hypothetical protein
VIATDVLKNIVYVGQGKNHLGLYRKVLFIGNQDIHWIRPDLTKLYILCAAFIFIYKTMLFI